MASRKGRELEAWLRAPTAEVFVVLLHGSDRGLVSERAHAFASRSGVSLDDPFSVVRLDATELDRDPGRLLQEANTIPLFGPRRLLWIKNAGAHKTLADEIKLLLEKQPPDLTILIEAGDLKKGSPLRASVESRDGGMALPCYPDARRDLDSVIDAELQAAGVRLSGDAREALHRNLGGDRLASRSELLKLLLFAHGKDEIGLEDVRATTGDVSAVSMDDAVDAMLDGRVSDFDAAFTRSASTGSQAYQVLAAALRQLQTLHSLRGSLGRGGEASALVAGAKPPIFYSRRPTMESALRRLNVEDFDHALAGLQAAVLLMRQRPELSISVARQALLAVALRGQHAQ